MRTENGAGLYKVPDKTRLILNERFLAFPFGQNTPTCMLDAAFELGKKSARLGVDDNPFALTRRRVLRCATLYRHDGYDRHRGAEAVAWLRGHYLASKAYSKSSSTTSIGLSGFAAHSSREAA